MKILEIVEMDAKAIGERLMELRGERTQAETAKELNISVSALSMYERGERIPRDNIKIRIAALFQKPISEIFYP
jgi:DNA-binding XRE family transcriptional regulator|uniref:Helix-turn-helix domain protein n=1 Tax=Siphoviridae sp. ctk4d14 TaxID=2825639 RepID=A0A8S5QJ05_9CAUD|nr:MAG TPA: helix-turn-helix domain protein [Siphoviridae sp. ctk4d14]DAY86483.1 MAG TPA: helix-turn-helix domain protein [Caudoviricetes sp.]